MMNRTAMRAVSALLIAAFAAAALGVTAMAAGYIGEDAAADVVMKHMGLEQGALEDMTVQLHESSKHPPIYEVQFLDGKLHARYLIDAKTGEILCYKAQPDRPKGENA
ncbi:MAG: PepSY domain-containing protein [Oscillospiraceae bacterium]|nr:PepSY domain-containing protein [Oscillospiraceae bacterium]